MPKYKVSRKQENNFKKNQDHRGRIHYQVYLQEDRPPQPKEEEEIEY
ncbi:MULTISPECIES: hypothetical protein [Bacillaceae]|uniref:Uncharacterized protein n=1 Tax=Evansella alkalicola TaxID=745819 RepID=A0ABS6JU58_9BACI|nr:MULTISPECIES: hypothetical protein [Bacillaceae]MBU9722104.1 hypothetical protein [Bacillus alkalicola]